MALPGQPRTSQDEPRPELRDVSRVRFSPDVAASLWPSVAAAAFQISPVVAASLLPAVAAAAISTKDDGSLLPTVAAAAHSE